MNLKQQSAQYALEQVESGMLLGLGTGSTTAYFIDLLGEAVKSGRLKDIRGVPTSEATAQRARELGIPLVTLAELGQPGAPAALDLAVDGADEVDPQLNLIKGLGKALLREKIVEIHARRFIIIVDESKLVARLGRGPMPVEIVIFEAENHIQWLQSLGCRAELWRDEAGQPYTTDNGNFLARCWFEGANSNLSPRSTTNPGEMRNKIAAPVVNSITGRRDFVDTEPGIADPHALANLLALRPGIVEHGLFLDMATQVIVAAPSGIRVMERPA